MNVPATLIIGGGIHALVGAGVFFASGEPHKAQIFVATILKGLLVALLISFTLNASSSHGMGAGALLGLLYGLAFGFVVFLAKGTDFKSTPHLLIGSLIQGSLSGVLIARFAFGSGGVF